MKKIVFPSFKNKSERTGFIVCIVANILFLLWATVSVEYLDKPPQQWTPWTFNLSLIVFGLVGDSDFGSGCLRALGYLFVTPFVLGIVFFAGCFGLTAILGILSLIPTGVLWVFFYIERELVALSPAGVGAIIVSALSIMSAIAFVRHQYRRWKEGQG